MENRALSLQNFDDESPEEFSSLADARRLVLKYGWNSTSYQIINPGIRRWFARDGDAVVGFVVCAGVRVVVGAPICAGERLTEIAAEFERDAASKGERVCFFGAETRLESVYLDSPKYSQMLLGAQPVWNPRNWARIVKENSSLRAQINRARNKGVVVSEWSSEKARDNPLLRECLHLWLAEKGLPPLHFMVETDTLGRLFDRRVFVAERDSEVVGFLVLSPVTRRNGWLFEQFVHKPGSPNGTVTIMIDRAMRSLAETDCQYATLGLAPLSTRAQIAPFYNPFWLRVLLAWMRIHAQRFYNFNGLDNFKAKLKPEQWEPVFAVSNEPRISPRTLFAIAAAFSRNAPFKLILGGLWRAFETEIGWFKQKLDRNPPQKT